MLSRNIAAGLFIYTAAVLLWAQGSLSNVLPTPEDDNTKATNTEEVGDIASTGIANDDNDHHESVEESTEDDNSENYEEYSSEESAEVAFNEQVVNFAIKEVGAFSNKSLSAIKAFLESVTTDGAYDDAKDLSANGDYFQDFILKIKKLEKDDKDLSKFALLDDIGYTLHYYKTHLDVWLTWDDVSDDIKVRVELFKKHNFKSLVSELHAITEDFKKTFKNKVYEFWQKLPTEERGSEKDFDNWFKIFVNRKRLLYNSVLFEGIY